MRRTVSVLVCAMSVSLTIACSASAPAASPVGAATTTAPSPTEAAAAPPRTRIDPVTLDRGPDPRVVYYDQREQAIHDGARVLPARFPGTVARLAKVVGGYVLDSEGDRGSVIRKVSRTGEAQVLARVSNFGVFGLVSADRRRLVYYPSVRRWHAVVMRLSDGRVLASRAFDDQPRVVLARPHRALLSNGLHTYWWKYRGDRTTRVADDPAVQAAFDVDRLVLDRRGTGSDYLTSLSRPREPSSSWRRGQPAGRFSPDGRRILTLSPEPAARYDGAYVAVRVRGTRQGHATRVFTGRLGKESYEQEPRWETSSTFLVLARAPETAKGQRVAWVRCTVRGSCENASPLFAAATGPAQWVLASQPAH